MIDVPIPIEQIAAILTESGYRRTSIKYRLASRIDVADGARSRSRLGGSYYRRVLSRDVLEVPLCVSRLLRTCVDGEPDRYLPLHPSFPLAFSRLKQLGGKRIK